MVHTIVECAKLAFADREAWYGDPDFVDVPLKDLLAARYAEHGARLVGDTASLELRPGAPAAGRRGSPTAVGSRHGAGRRHRRADRVLAGPDPRRHLPHRRRRPRREHGVGHSERRLAAVRLR